MTPTIRDRVRAFMAPRTADTVPRGAVPVVSSSEQSLFNTIIGRDQLVELSHYVEVCKAYRAIYQSGGIVRTAIDTYTMFMLASGWALQSDDTVKDTLKTVQDTFFSRTGALNTTLLKCVTDAISIGDGYAKIIYGSGQYANTPIGLQHLPAERVRSRVDTSLEVRSYELLASVGGSIVTARIEPSDVIHICLFPCGGRAYGVGLLESAWDDIKHDTDTSEGTAAAIKRHGYGIWHVTVSSTNPEVPVRVQDVAAVKAAVTNLNARTEIVTDSTVGIKSVNETGQTNIGSYADWSVGRLCTAMGIPAELLGLRQGTTDATAVTRVENYYKKIQTLQTTLADAINTQYIDRILTSIGATPGSVWIEFADPTPEDDIKRAQYIAQISATTPGDPFAIMSRAQQQAYLGIDSKQWQKDEDAEWANATDGDDEPT